VEIEAAQLTEMYVEHEDCALKLSHLSLTKDLPGRGKHLDFEAMGPNEPHRGSTHRRVILDDTNYRGIAGCTLSAVRQPPRLV